MDGVAQQLDVHGAFQGAASVKPQRQANRDQLQNLVMGIAGLWGGWAGLWLRFQQKMLEQCDQAGAGFQGLIKGPGEAVFQPQGLLAPGGAADNVVKGGAQNEMGCPHLVRADAGGAGCRWETTQSGHDAVVESFGIGRWREARQARHHSEERRCGARNQIDGGFVR